MFDKDRSREPVEQESREETRIDESVKKSGQQEFSPRCVSYFGPGMTLSGEVTLEEGLVIEGTFEGKVTSTDENLTVGKKGRVKGELRGTAISVRGSVEGTIHGEEVVRLYPTAVVDGTVYCARLIIDEGATLNGNVDMAADHSSSTKAKLTTVDAGDTPSQAAG